MRLRSQALNRRAVMFRYALIYGGIAGTVVIAILAAGLTFFSDRGFTSSQAYGYLVMLVILSLIFVGVKRFRDIECGGVVGFGRALGLGLSIAAIAGVFYVVSWEVVLAVTDFAFIEQYSASMIEAARSLPEAERSAQLAEIESFKETYRNPLVRLPMTFSEIFPVGALVALISAAVLRNPRILPARKAA
jgi:hypothetical protein